MRRQEKRIQKIVGVPVGDGLFETPLIEPLPYINPRMFANEVPIGKWTIEGEAREVTPLLAAEIEARRAGK